MISTSIANENLSLPPNTNSITSTRNNLSQSSNCDSNQQTDLFVHHVHQPLHSTNSQSISQSHYQPHIALPTALNSGSAFYTPHFTNMQFSPNTSSTSIAVSSAFTNNVVVSSIGTNQTTTSLYGKVQGFVSNHNFCNGNDDNSRTVVFIEPTQSVSLGGYISNENASANSSGSGSGSLTSSNCSAISSCSTDNGGTSSSGSISSLTSASQYELYHTNSLYSKFRQNEIKPESNENYEEKYLHAFSESDIALATKPGAQIYFDPAVCHFSDEDLRPQPMNKKSRKQNVPECLKDEKYWARRAKNNVAAKKSREQRRLKENQVLLRASYLEKQNQALRVELQLLRCEHAKLANYLPQ